MDNFSIEKWGEGYPGFYVSFKNAVQLNDFITALKTYDKDSKGTLALSTIYVQCLNMPSEEKECAFDIDEDFFNRHFDIERVDEKIFHCSMSSGWSTCRLVVDLNGSIKGDYHFFGSFNNGSLFPSNFHEILKEVARNNPDQDFCGRIYADDGDHFSDTVEFSYANRVLAVSYDDDSGCWAQHSVTVEI